MRKFGCLLVLLAVCLFQAGPVVAEDVGRFLPGNLMLMLRIRIQPFTGPGMLAAQHIPDLAKSLAAMDKDVEERLGCLPQRDLQAAGFWLTDEFDMTGRKCKPRSAVGFLAGVFQPEKAWNALQEIVEKTRGRKPDTSLKIDEIDGKKFIMNRSVRGTFVTPGLFMLGRHETMGKIVAGGQNPAFSFPEGLAAASSDARFFIFFDVEKALGLLDQCPKVRIPWFLEAFIRPIRTIAVFDAGDTINIQVTCEKEESMALMKKTLEVGIANIELLMNGMERDLDSKIGQGASVIDLLGHLRVRKVALAIHREMIKSIKLDQQGKGMTLKFTLPEVLKAQITPGTLFAVAGLAAAHIGTRFARMRRTARIKRTPPPGRRPPAQPPCPPPALRVPEQGNPLPPANPGPGKN